MTPRVHFGNDALQLHRAAADAALPGGDQAILARDLAQAAEFISHATGLIADMPPAEEVDAPLTEARALAAGDLAAEARVRSKSGCPEGRPCWRRPGAGK